MAASGSASSSAAATLPPPPPPGARSPPKYPDFCGRHRLQVEVQIMNREIGFLEEELQSLDGLQSVSRCCKEINEFVGTKQDPLIPLNKKRRKSLRIWRWLRAKLCCNFSWMCCSSKCSLQLKRPSCSCCNCCNCCTCPNPKNWNCCRCQSGCRRRCYYCCCCSCFSKCWQVSCCRPRCALPSFHCPEYSCGCVCSCPKCTEVCLCPGCTRTCCISRCLC